MQDVYGAIQDAGAELVAISPQNMEHSQETATLLSLTYPVCSDAGNAVAEQYGLKFAFPGYAQEAYREIGADLATYNAADPWTLPVPGLFVISPDGVIQHASVDSDYRNRIEPALVLEKLQSL